MERPKPVYHISAGNHDGTLRRCFFKDLLACADPGQHPREHHVVQEFRAPRFSPRTTLRPRRLCGFRARLSQVSRGRSLRLKHPLLARHQCSPRPAACPLIPPVCPPRAVRPRLPESNVAPRSQLYLQLLRLFTILTPGEEPVANKTLDFRGAGATSRENFLSPPEENGRTYHKQFRGDGKQ